jgi:hypothetical protein
MNLESWIVIGVVVFIVIIDCIVNIYTSCKIDKRMTVTIKETLRIKNIMIDRLRLHEINMHQGRDASGKFLPKLGGK